MDLRRVLKAALFIVIDMAIVVFSAIVPLALRFGIFTMEPGYLIPTLECLPVDIAIAIFVLAVFRLYSRVWTYAGMDEMLSTFGASVVIEFVYIIYRVAFSIDMPRSFFVFNWIFLFVLLTGSRISVRFIKQHLRRFEKRRSTDRRILVVGAGAAGALLIRELRYGPGDAAVVCVIDDDPSKTGSYIHSAPVVGTREDITKSIDKYKIDEIIIAIPSASPTTIRELVTLCQQCDVKLRRLPAITSSLTASLSSAVRDVNYEDLLGRAPVIIKNSELENFVYGRTIMITGGGGTIGSELCRQVVANHPKRIVIVDIYENSAYELQAELHTYYPEADISVLIASVRDYDRMESIFREYRPDVIYHAAAHKHVPLMEYSPNEAVKNNCKGTLNMVKLADEYNVLRFILISTDKAVRPTNVMGATKRICEMIIQSYNKMSRTEYVAVRFGNVLGSNGSVIPLFLKQIECGGPVTVTHREITRFFMTVSEAVSLVLQAGLMAKGGEIFVLDMGQPVKIYDMAVNLIKLKGYVPHKDIEIKITGLRPGEKLYEELLMEEEGLIGTSKDLIYIGQPIDMDCRVFLKQLDELIRTAEKNETEIKDAIQHVCGTYRPVEMMKTG